MRVTCSMGMSLDGFATAPDGGLDWAAPSDEVFQSSLDDLGEVGVHLMGRRLYEAMLYWESAEQDRDLGPLQREWAARWKQLPKVVLSRTLTHVEGTGTRLATGGLVEEVERWRSGPGNGDVAVGGATLAGEAAALGLLDEYRVRIYPVLLGGGTPLFSRTARQDDLELLDTRTFDAGVVRLRYRVRR